MSSSPSPSPSDVKRRVRVVMSCDQCRSKKIKCVRLAGQIACKPCFESQNPCTFRDRDHYQVQRDLINAKRIAPGGDGSCTGRSREGSPYGSHSTPLGGQGASMAFYSFAMSPDQSASSSGSTPEAEPSQFTFSAGFPRSPSSRGSLPPDSHSSGSGSRPKSAVFPPPQPQPQHVLWSKDDPSQPNPELMTHYIDTFFTYLGHTFPFMRYECVVGDYFTSTLPTLLANCIAALAVPFSFELKALDGINLRDASVLYAENAKSFVPHEEEAMSQVEVAALILLSHYEVQAGHSNEFRWYAQRAINAAVTSGLINEASICSLSKSDDHRDILRSMVASIAQLRQMLSTS